MLRKHSGYVKAKQFNRAENVVRQAVEEADCTGQEHAWKGQDYKGECDVQVVNRFRKRKPRAVLRWWKRRSAIEPVIGHVKSDHYMERNMLAGAAGDRLNAMLAAVGFNLVKLMRGLKRLFLCLRAEADGFVDFLAEHQRLITGGWRLEPEVLRYPRKIANRGFA